MLSTWIIVMSLINGFSGSPYSQCSCYDFDGTLKNWRNGRQHCGTQGGDLVSMETVEEWEFIKTQIQRRTTGIFDEWWIGLEKRDGRWTWVSNHPLTYDKWQPHNPRVPEYMKCVIMSKNYPNNTYGLFSNNECGAWKGRICEIKTKDCSNNQVKWCNNSVTSTPMTVSKTEQATTTDNELYTPSSTTTKSNNVYSEAGEYPTTTPHPKYYTEVSTNDGITGTTVVSLISKKKPSPTLTIIIVVLVVGVVVLLFCVVLCVYRWKRKRIEKPKPRVTYHVTNNDHHNSDFIAGSFSGLQPNNACAQEYSHPTTHGYPLDMSDPDSVVPKSRSQGCLVQPMIYDALEVDDYSNMTLLESAGKDSNHTKANTETSNPSGRNSPQEHVDSQGQSDAVEKSKVSDIYAIVDKSKKKNKAATEVVYAQVNKKSKKTMKQDLVTYANLEGFNHDAPQNTAPKDPPPPPYHPTEYAYASNK